MPPAQAVHSDLNQASRERALSDFKSGRVGDGMFAFRVSMILVIQTGKWEVSHLPYRHLGI